MVCPQRALRICSSLQNPVLPQGRFIFERFCIANKSAAYLQARNRSAGVHLQASLQPCRKVAGSVLGFACVNKHIASLKSVAGVHVFAYKHKYLTLRTSSAGLRAFMHPAKQIAIRKSAADLRDFKVVESII